MLTALIPINSVRDHGSEALAEGARSRVDSVRATVKHSYALEENRIHEVEALSLTFLRWSTFRSLQSDEPFSDSNSIDRCRDILGALIAERNQSSEFVYFNSRDLVKLRFDYRHNCRTAVDYQGIRNFLSYGEDRAAGHAEACVHSGCTDTGSGQFFLAFSSRIGGSNIQCHDNCAASSDCCSDVPEVLPGSSRPRDDHPDAGQSEERDTDDQPNGGQMCQFPRAFHGSPVFDFRAIVARPREGV